MNDEIKRLRHTYFLQSFNMEGAGADVELIR